MEAERQRFDSLVMHTPHGDARYRLPWTFSTFDYRELCELLWRDCDAALRDRQGERARRAGQRRRRDRRRDRPRRPLRPARRRRARLAPHAGRRRRLPAARRAALARARGPPRGPGEDLEIWIDRRYVPAGYGWSFPPATSCGSASAPSTPASTSATRPSCSPRTSASDRVRYQGNWIPHKLRRATEGGVFFAGDSAGHCLPLSAEGIRTALYFGIAWAASCAGSSRGGRAASRRRRRYAEFNDSHEWKFRWMLRVQRLVPRIPPRLLGPLVRLLGAKRFVDWSFDHYLQIAPPDFAASADDQTVPASSRATPTPAPG